MIGRSIRAKAAAVVIVGTLVLGGTEAAFANFNAGTRLSISKRPNGKVKRGTRVKFTGSLKSSRRFCESRQRVVLMRKNRVVGGDKTTSRGQYRIREKVKRSGRYRVRFNGVSRGTHPNIKTCRASSSKSVRVRTTRR
ncbi:MAG: hypothetical protein WEA10_01110 [Actinomycetota bacterium]